VNLLCFPVGGTSGLGADALFWASPKPVRCWCTTHEPGVFPDLVL